MSKIQWEYDLVEKTFCEQLRAMGWQWIKGDTDVPELTERVNFREVLLKGRLEAALKRITQRDGKPWLDEARVSRAIRDLERAEGNRLMEIIQSATALLLKGTVAKGLPDWEHGRPQPIAFIDFEDLTKNDFLVMNQFKSPGIENPLQEAINQLLIASDFFEVRAANSRPSTATRSKSLRYWRRSRTRRHVRRLTGTFALQC